MLFPLFKPIPYQNPEQIANLFADEPQLVFLDSSAFEPERGRFSYVCARPFLTWEANAGGVLIDGKRVLADPLHVLGDYLALYRTPHRADLPPFQGGVAGFFSYDLARTLERLPSLACEDVNIPDGALGFFDVVIAFDQRDKQAWIISTGFPALDPAKRAQQARDRMLEFEMVLRSRVQMRETQCQISTPRSAFSQQAYVAGVERAQAYIRAGDIFEVNLSQRFVCEVKNADPFALYGIARQHNGANFGAYCRWGMHAILSCSPERFLQVNDRYIETRPIKGTCRRLADPILDSAAQQALLCSEKDRAENIMIVDLMRNDLAKICTPQSVQVTQLCALESTASVHHLVSVVEGTLRDNISPVDVVRACFPGGSITGAPKVRAMEIIELLEPTRRGVYCGSIGFIGFDGTMDLSIVIRTMHIHNNKLTFQVGGAVTLDSDPREEYEETLAKAAGIFHVLDQVMA